MSIQEAFLYADPDPKHLIQIHITTFDAEFLSVLSKKKLNFNLILACFQVKFFKYLSSSEANPENENIDSMYFQSATIDNAVNLFFFVCFFSIHVIVFDFLIKKKLYFLNYTYSIFLSM